MLPTSMLLDLLKATSLCMVCYGNVSSMRHIYGKSFDNTRQHIFLKTDARKSRSRYKIQDTRYKNLYFTSDTFKQITLAIKAIFRQTYYKANIQQVKKL